MRRLLLPAAAIACLLAGSVRATVLTPGESTVVTDSTDAYGGAIIDSRVDSFSRPVTLVNPGPGGYTQTEDLEGTFTQEVRRQSNGTLSFFYELEVTKRDHTPAEGTFAPAVSNVEITGFDPSLSLDVWGSPVTVSWEPANVATHAFGFLFNSGSPESIPNNNAILMVYTNATAYASDGLAQLTLFSPIKGEQNDNLPGFRPLAVGSSVPEPASLTLLPLAIGGLVLRLRRP